MEMGDTITTSSGGTRIVTSITPASPKTVTPYLLRQFMAGMSQTALDALPNFLRGQLETIGRRMQRQAFRAHKREDKAREYRAAALAGGSLRERLRRGRQVALYQINEANGLVRG